MIIIIVNYELLSQIACAQEDGRSLIRRSL